MLIPFTQSCLNDYDDDIYDIQAEMPFNAALATVVTPSEVPKAQSLAVLLKEIGMTKEEMIAVGDGFNDLSMIQYAGLGVAMANAQEIVRQNADYITLSNEEDGVAAVVEKFIL